MQRIAERDVIPVPLSRQMCIRDSPGAMKDAVCSPGGTTIKGVASLEKDAFRGAVINAIDAIEG